MKKKSPKSPKLRKFTCVICGNEFYNYFSPSEISKGKGKVCSKECKNKLNGINKTKGKYISCIECGKLVWERPSEPRKYCSECWSKRIGKSISTDGYYVYNDKKVHRTVYEKHIGRKLCSDEIIHHINGDKLDNRLCNLQLVTRSEHNKIHKFFGNKD